MTNTNRAIYRVAMRQLEARDFIRWASAEPELTPLEAELLARYSELFPLADYCNERGLDAAELLQMAERFEEIDDEVGSDIEALADGQRAAAFLRDMNGINAPIPLLMRWYNDATSDEPRTFTEYVYDAETGRRYPRAVRRQFAEYSEDGSAVTIPASQFQDLLENLRRLDYAVFEATN